MVGLVRERLAQVVMIIFGGKMYRQNLQPGLPVRVSIQDHWCWNKGAVESLNNKEGTVVLVNVAGKALVEFKKPAPKFYANGLEHKRFWFESYNLKKM